MGEVVCWQDFPLLPEAQRVALRERTSVDCIPSEFGRTLFDYMDVSMSCALPLRCACSEAPTFAARPRTHLPPSTLGPSRLAGHPGRPRMARQRAAREDGAAALGGRPRLLLRPLRPGALGAGHVFRRDGKRSARWTGACSTAAAAACLMASHHCAPQPCRLPVRPAGAAPPAVARDVPGALQGRPRHQLLAHPVSPLAGLLRCHEVRSCMAWPAAARLHCCCVPCDAPPCPTRPPCLLVCLFRRASLTAGACDDGKPLGCADDAGWLRIIWQSAHSLKECCK